jgi:malate permease and related proteins
MGLFLTVAEIVAPVFLLAAVGFAWVRLGMEYRLQFVTRMAMTLATPCLIFGALMQTEIAPQALATVSLAAIVAYGALTALFWGFVAATGLERRTYLAPLIFGNTGNVGLPLALFAFGEAGLSYAVVIFAVMAIWSFTFGIWLVSGGGAPGKVVREPLVWATALGILFLAMGWQTPRFLTNAIDLIGQMAIPLMLITLGVAVARLRPERFGRAVWLSLFRVALGVAVAAATGRWFGLDHVALSVLILQVATPVAVTSYLLAEKFGADADAVAGLVVISTLLSVATIPLALAFLI